VQGYGVREVERLLRLSRSTLRALIRAGFVTPARGPRRARQFSFQDLIVLRTAQALAGASLPARRITRSLKQLRRRLPPEMPLSGLAIAAEGDRVVVKEGRGRWQADSGQYLLGFEGDPAAGALRVVERKPGAQEWFERGAALEGKDPAGATRAYEQAIAAAPKLASAYQNLGSLLHGQGELARAERVYRSGIRACGAQAPLLYNLGVLLEDRERKREALEAYRAALRADPELADCHYNLALLLDGLKRPKEAIRHLARYRKLVGRKE